MIKLIPKCQNNGGNSFGKLSRKNLDTRNLQVISNVTGEPATIDPKYNHEWALQNLEQGELTTPSTHLGYVLPEVVVEGAKPLVLETYPFGHPNNLISHSSLTVPGGAVVTGKFKDSDYNLITNNCSDHTGKALEAIFKKEYSPGLISTPYDTMKYAESLGGKTKKTKKGYYRTVIPITPAQAQIAREESRKQLAFKRDK